MAVRIAPRSLRSRLAVLFAIGSGAVLLASGAFLYVNLNHQLTSAIDDGLSARADDIVSDLHAGLEAIRQNETFAALLRPDGTVIDTSSNIDPNFRVLTDESLRRVGRGDAFFDRDHVPGLGRRARLLARLDRTSRGDNVVVVVGASLDAIAGAQRRLGIVLALISPLLVAALAGGGWFLTGAALRPVGEMAAEAEAITLSEVGRRLPQPGGDDEIARLGHTLNAMLDRIEASIAHERSFLDDASHELRTPLSILRAELELALQQPGDHHSVEQALRSALEEAERLGHIADDLLVLARADAGHAVRRAERLDLRAVANAVAERVSGHSGAHVDVVGDAVSVVADRQAMEQILTNLVANALRHAHGHVQIETGQAADGWVTATVADDGPGFPADTLPTVFDRFARADAARRRGGGGAGLGLAIVAALAQAHGGWVEAANGPPLGGALVRVTLPVGRAQRGKRGTGAPKGSRSRSRAV